MLTLEQIEKLQLNEQLIVTRTGETWEVKGIKIQRDRLGRIQSFRVNINNGHIDSYFDETRLHLFDLFETLASNPQFPSANEMANGLRPGFETAYKSLEEQEKINERIENLGNDSDEIDEKKLEDKITKQPELTKPAKKPKRKNK